MPFDLGDVAALVNPAFTDTSGAPANATACTLTITLPDQSTLTANPTADADNPGVYPYNYLTTQAGRHTVAWSASGTPGPGVGVGAYIDAFDVWPTASTGIISLADAKKTLKLTGTSQFDDDVRDYILSITSWVEKYCGPVIPQLISGERQRAGGMFITLNRPPIFQPAGQAHQLVAMTPVLTYGLVYDLSLLTVEFSTGIVRHSAGLPFIYGPYDFSYWSGRPIISSAIQRGSRALLRHQWAQERGGAGSSAAFTADDETTVIWGFAVPNRVIEMLEGERAVGGIA